MNPERFERVREVYHAVLDRPSGERAAFLEQACSGDAALRDEIQSLLAAGEEAGSFLAAPETALETQPL